MHRSRQGARGAGSAAFTKEEGGKRQRLPCTAVRLGSFSCGRVRIEVCAAEALSIDGGGTQRGR